MALKVPFLMTASVLWLYWSKVPDVANSYSSVTCHRFQQIGRNVLYEFVTHSGMVDKWLSVVSFVATDQRPMGVGKTYKVILDQSVLYFNVTEHVAGHHIALESDRSLFQPRLEFWFYANNLMSKIPPASIESQPPASTLTVHAVPPISSAALAAVVDWRRTTNDISGEWKHHRPHHHQQQHHELEHQADEADCPASSSLGLKFYFKHNSLLFQKTLGSLLRLTLQQQFRRSLRHLDLILNDMNEHRLV